ncbi:MarR family winged helix-turn-helix transcriptional regulator [Kutzneria sp. NPDC052558]|uniref:MarR family winged helix-turn-helix transcriptional regulator n=1 Tax=Kutzneria sp. NPDC052558 TaxID=3364121 RepID=UPI0037C9410F
MSITPRWLDSDERQAWDAFIGLLLKLPHALDAAVRKRTGLTHFEYAVLSNLSEADWRTRSMGELAEFVNASPSRLSHVVAKLEQRDLVRRSACPTSARITLATLTDEGVAVVVEAAPLYLEAVRSLVIDALEPAQLPHLTAISTSLLENLANNPV